MNNSSKFYQNIKWQVTIFSNPILHEFRPVKVALGGEKIKHEEYRNLLTDFLKLMKTGGIVNKELHKILELIFISGNSF